MASSRTSLYFSTTMNVVITMGSALASAGFAVVHFVRTTCNWAFERVADFLTGAVAKFERPVLRLVARPVELVQACAYALKLAKRERPRVRDQWRMCPSI